MLSKALRLGAVVGTVALLLFSANNVFAQSQCASQTTSHGPGHFIVNVTQETQNGRRIYTYSMSSPGGHNPSKFFIWVAKGLNLEEPINTFECLGGCSLSYVTPHETAGAFPPAEAWKVAHHQDGVVSPAVSINKQFRFTVNERFKPEESVTTILLAKAGGYEHCGPIFGPTTPRPTTIEGSPLQAITAELTMANGCKYIATANLTDNLVTNLTAHPDTPNATVAPFEACTVETEDCATALGLVFCPPVKLGDHFLQSVPGGTCYAPRNIKFPC